MNEEAIRLHLMRVFALKELLEDRSDLVEAFFTNYSLQGSSEFVFEVSRRRRGPQYQRSTGDNPLQEIFAF